MAAIIRTDIHRPSAIIPTDYEFVGMYVRQWQYTFDASATVIAVREGIAVRNHMMRTGGQWSNHEHGGSCHICGAHAVYLAVFYHEKTNSYIRTGMDCADKMDMGDPQRFRRLTDAIQAAQKSRAGWKKAEGFLINANLSAAWDVFTACNRPNAQTLEGALRQAGMTDPVAMLALNDYFLDAGIDPLSQPMPQGNEERTIIDIVEKLAKYGSLTPKQCSFLAALVSKIQNRPVTVAKEAAKQEKWAEEKAKADDVPTGRKSILVTVIKTDVKYDQFSLDGRPVMTCKADIGGYVVWGTIPAAIASEVQKGTKLNLTATFEASERDPKFGFFKRPFAQIV